MQLRGQDHLRLLVRRSMSGDENAHREVRAILQDGRQRLEAARIDGHPPHLRCYAFFFYGLEEVQRLGAGAVVSRVLNRRRLDQTTYLSQLI